MSHPALELQAALLAALKADAELAALLAADGIRDAPARGQAHPFVSIGDLVTRDPAADWPGREHRLTLTAWSRAGGRSELLRIMERAGVIFQDLPAALGAHRLVSLTRESERIDRGRDGRSWRATIGIRALTEPYN